MAVIVRSLANHQVGAIQDQLVAIYRAAFKAPPYCKGQDEVLEFARSLPQNLKRDDFRLVVAAENETDTLLGFCFGYKITPDLMWPKVVAKAVRPQIAAEWLVNSYQLVEMAVRPNFQGQGIGGLLHDRLLEGLSYRRAVLLTMAAESNATWMYHKRGWRVLLEAILFPGLARPYQLMGLKIDEEGGPEGRVDF